MPLIVYGGAGDTYGSLVDVYGDAPDSTPFATEGVLGPTRAYQVFIADRSGKDLLVDLPVTSGSWERVVSETAVASVEIAGLSGSRMSGCCALLEDVDAWANELHIYRNFERVWRGPITGMQFNDESITISASDVSAWLSRRRIHEDHNHVNVDLAKVFADYVSDAMSVDPVPGLEVAAGKSRVFGTRRVRGRQRRICRQLLDEMTRTGLNWTVLDGTMIVGRPTNRILELRDAHFAQPPTIEVDGVMATEVSVIGAGGTSRNDGTVGVARNVDREVRERYGVHEVVATEDRIKDTQSATKAAENRLRRLGLPANLVRSGTLDPLFPLTQNRIVPGLRANANLTQTCRPVRGRYRVTKVTGTFSLDAEDISIDVQPPGGEVDV